MSFPSNATKSSFEVILRHVENAFLGCPRTSLCHLAAIPRYFSRRGSQDEWHPWSSERVGHLFAPRSLLPPHEAFSVCSRPPQNERDAGRKENSWQKSPIEEMHEQGVSLPEKGSGGEAEAWHLHRTQRGEAHDAQKSDFPERLGCFSSERDNDRGSDRRTGSVDSSAPAPVVDAARHCLRFSALASLIWIVISRLGCIDGKK